MIKNLKKATKILVSIVITYLLVELVCFIFMRIKFTGAHFPSFSFQYNYKKYDFPIAEINPVWGTWHYPGTYVEKKQCFESVYHINSFGARDKERTKLGDTNRIVFLGDSFIEGYGLKESQRLSNRLENLSNKECMNFGCGYFTPTQEYLLYENFAGDFSHNTVVIGILPFNDLAEDDTNFHEQDGFIHYQPFFQGSYPDYKIIYRENSISKSTFNKEGYYSIQNNLKARSKRFLKEFSFWYNIFQFIKNNKAARNESRQPFSGYYDCTNAQLEKLCFILEKIKMKAGGKKIVVVAIPVYNDFLRSGTTAVNPFSQKMDSFCNKNMIEYLDLLPLFKKKVADPKQLYFSCDGHWNDTANKIAAELILPLLRK